MVSSLNKQKGVKTMLLAEGNGMTKGLGNPENHQGREIMSGEHFCIQHNPRERVGTSIYWVKE